MRNISPFKYPQIFLFIACLNASGVSPAYSGQNATTIPIDELCEDPELTPTDRLYWRLAFDSWKSPREVECSKTKAKEVKAANADKKYFQSGIKDTDFRSSITIEPLRQITDQKLQKTDRKASNASGEESKIDTLRTGNYSTIQQ